MKNILTKLLLMTAILTLAGNFNVFAGNTDNLINEARLHRNEVIKEISKNNKDFLDIRRSSMQKMHKMNDYQTTIEAIKNKYQNQLMTSGKSKKSEKAIFFVSFSMPDLSLKQIIHDASKYQIPVVIRGLYKNSFRKTIEKIFELVKENNKGGIAINPRWFKEYDIKAVPAVVVVSDCRTDKNNENNENNENNKNKENRKNKISDVVYGNIPIRKSLSIIAERGEASNVALGILSRAD